MPYWSWKVVLVIKTPNIWILSLDGNYTNLHSVQVQWVCTHVLLFVVGNCVGERKERCLAGPIFVVPRNMSQHCPKISLKHTESLSERSDSRALNISMSTSLQMKLQLCFILLYDLSLLLDGLFPQSSQKYYSMFVLKKEESEMHFLYSWDLVVVFKGTVRMFLSKL